MNADGSGPGPADEGARATPSTPAGTTSRSTRTSRQTGRRSRSRARATGSLDVYVMDADGIEHAAPDHDARQPVRADLVARRLGDRLPERPERRPHLRRARGRDRRAQAHERPRAGDRARVVAGRPLDRLLAPPSRQRDPGGLGRASRRLGAAAAHGLGRGRVRTGLVAGREACRVRRETRDGPLRDLHDRRRREGAAPGDVLDRGRVRARLVARRLDDRVLPRAARS